MNKYTSGPWTVGYKCYQVTADNENMNICDVRGWGYLTGAGGLNLPHDKAKEIQDANAHLISAAPDMLEVLKNTRAMLPMFITSRDMLGMKLLETINTVIIKAEGKL